MVNAALLFAAGFGTRMGALTQNQPKPMIPLNGQPMIEHALGHVRAAGIKRVVVNTHYLGDQIAQHLAGRDIAISHETPQVLETGGGLAAARPLLGDGPVVTLNTDTLWTRVNPVEQLRAAWTPAQMRALLLLVPRARAQMYRGPGDLDLIDGRIQRRSGEMADYVYAGAQIIDQSALDGLTGAFSLNVVWDMLIETGQAYGVVHTGDWVDVGRPDAIPIAEAALNADV